MNVEDLRKLVDEALREVDPDLLIGARELCRQRMEDLPAQRDQIRELLDRLELAESDKTPLDI